MANGHGGKRENAGNKPKVDSEKVNVIILTAIKQIKGVDTDEEAKIEFVKDLYESQRGQIFLAEHLLGKPKETIENKHTFNDFDIKEMMNFGKSK